MNNANANHTQAKCIQRHWFICPIVPLYSIYQYDNNVSAVGIFSTLARLYSPIRWFTNYYTCLHRSLHLIISLMFIGFHNLNGRRILRQVTSSPFSIKINKNYRTGNSTDIDWLLDLVIRRNFLIERFDHCCTALRRDHSLLILLLYASDVILIKVFKRKQSASNFIRSTTTTTTF